MRKIKDPVILGMISGILGNFAKMAGNMFNRYVFKKSDTTYPEIASGLFMTKKEREKPVGKLVGALADIGLGGILGIVMVYILRYSGKDRAGLKGLAMGHFAWITMYGVLGRGLGTKKGVFPLNADTNMSAFINHSWYGLVTALAASRLGDPRIFNQPVTQKQLGVRTGEVKQAAGTGFKQPTGGGTASGQVGSLGDIAVKNFGQRHRGIKKIR